MTTKKLTKLLALYIEKYLNRKAKIHPGDEFIVVDADSLPSA